MTRLKTPVPTDTWVVATWDEYIQTIDNPAYQKAKCYYHNGKLRIEMTPLGYDHASDHTVIIFGVNLFAALKDIPLHGLDNCTYRKTGGSMSVLHKMLKLTKGVGFRSSTQPTKLTCTQTGFDDAQPDVSYYIGDNADVIPWGTSK